MHSKQINNNHSLCSAHKQTRPAQVLYEHYFQCDDLGRDLVPVVKAFKASEEAATLIPGNNIVSDADRPFEIDTTTTLPEPFKMKDFLTENAEAIANGSSVPLFGPEWMDKEFSIQVIGGPSEQVGVACPNPSMETMLYQMTGYLFTVQQ